MAARYFNKPSYKVSNQTFYKLHCKKWCQLFGLFLGTSIFASSSLCLAQTYKPGKLIATSGINQLEGSGGGGLVPWATLTGYDTQDQTSLGLFSSVASVDDYRFQAWGIGAGFKDRFELTFTHQNFDLTRIGGDIKQNILGAKVRLYGDVVYSQWPQISIGVQHKKLLDPAVASLLNANDTDSGNDYYLAMTKVHLGALAGYNIVWNLTGRFTKANQMGLLGFGSAEQDSHELMLEGSVGLLLSRKLAIGFEFRQKPNHLALQEDHWRDVFITYLPNKSVSFTLAWADLGDIAGALNQQGIYASISGSIW